LPDDSELLHRRAVGEMAHFDCLPFGLREYLREHGLSASMAWELWSRWPDEGNVLAMLEQAKAQINAGAKQLHLTPPLQHIIAFSPMQTSCTSSTMMTMWR